MKNLKNLGTTLSRNEMRVIKAGRYNPESICVSNCADNSDCDCMSCGSGAGTMYCASLSCPEEVDGVFNKSYRKCSCGGNY